jgi:photosystem II stability/assembly factor-like uncharacterized protein
LDWRSGDIRLDDAAHRTLSNNGPMDRRRSDQSLKRREAMSKVVGLAMSSVTLIAALVAFSPRPQPPFKPTRLDGGQLIVNGLARAGARLVAVGEQGHALLSDDGGRRWREAGFDHARGSTLTQVQFVSPTVGIAVGHDGWIVRSTDGGASWHEVAFDEQRAEPLFGVWAGKNTALFAYGGFGRLLLSNDAGQHWQPVAINADERHLYGMDGNNAGTLLLVGEQGMMQRSADNGASWQRVPAFYDGSLFGVLSLGGADWLAYGMRGHVFRSGDNGTSWLPVPLAAPASLFGATLLADGRVLLVGQGGTIFESGDHGYSFRIVKAGGRQSLTAVLATQLGQVLTAGETGVRLDPALAGANPSSAAQGS